MQRVRELLVILLSPILTLQEVPAAQKLFTSDTISVRLSPIEVDTLHDLREELATNGPKDAHNINRYAVTSWKIAWRYRSEKEKWVTGLTLTTDISVVLPAWQPKSSVDAGSYQKWAEVYKALISHEYDHAIRPIQTTDAIHKDINSRIVRGRLAPLRADYIIRKHIAANNMWDTTYDRETAHGRLQGVSLVNVPSTGM